MTQDDHKIELDELLEALCEGHLTEESAHRLEQLVLETPQARRRYLDYLCLDTTLRLDMSTGLSRQMAELIDREIAEEVNQAGRRSIVAAEAKRSPVLGPLIDMTRQGTDFFTQHGMSPWLLLVVVFATATVCGLWASGVFRKSSFDASSPYIARLSETHDSVWDNDGSRLITGTGLNSGEEISLQSGLAELTFRNGAKVILEGPATFIVQNAAEGFLRRGKLVANVPKQAQGFTVHTDLVNVIDLGTEFALDVSNRQSVESHVFKGRVKLELLNPQGTVLATRELAAGQAMHIDALASKTRSIAVDPSRFCRTLSAERLLGRNLIDNADFESGIQGAPRHQGYLVNMQIPGWEDHTPATTFPYKSKGSFQGLREFAPGPVDRGCYYFVGVNDCEITQRINVEELASRIDKGRIRFDLSAWLGGRVSENDSIILDANFLDENGHSLGQGALGPVTATHRQSVSGLMHRQEEGPVPPGTRTVEILLKSIHAKTGLPATSNNPIGDGYADNLSLIFKEDGK